MVACDISAEWRGQGVDPIEVTRRLLDFCVVSVLLDAGAGPNWKYTVKGSSAGVGRSEGLALASLDMVASGMFSSQADQPFQVDGGHPRTHEKQSLTLFTQLKG